MKGMYAESLVIVENSLDSEMPFLSDAAYIYAKAGQRDKALAIIERWKEAEKKKYVMNYWVAVAYAALGDKGREPSLNWRSISSSRLVPAADEGRSVYGPLRDDPRFADCLKRIGLNP
jgi:hypothetical protein